MEKKITINGEELTIRFNMAVEVSYEEITDVPFSLDDLKYKRYVMCLYMAAILTNNPETKITLEWLMNSATSDDIKVIDDAMADCMSDFLHVPKIIPEEKLTEEQEGDEPKN